MSDSEFEFVVPMMASESVVSGGPLAVLARLKARALDIVEGTLEQYKSGGLKLPARDVFLKKASALYDTLCAATDIPVVGPAAEQALEQIMKPAYMKLVEFAYDRFAS